MASALILNVTLSVAALGVAVAALTTVSLWLRHGRPRGDGGWGGGSGWTDPPVPPGPSGGARKMPIPAGHPGTRSIRAPPQRDRCNQFLRRSRAGPGDGLDDFRACPETDRFLVCGGITKYQLQYGKPLYTKVTT